MPTTDIGPTLTRHPRLCKQCESDANYCQEGISRRNRIRNNLLADNGQNFLDDITPDSAITIAGNAFNNDVSQNTVMGNNGDGISVRDNAGYNTVSSNLAILNTSTDAPYAVDPITMQPIAPVEPAMPHFYDTTKRRAGMYNQIKTNNKCLTENSEVDSTVCNPGEKDDWQ
jgi:parallel beta-helix repeat protein